jgi:hypothetical protein
MNFDEATYDAYYAGYRAELDAWEQKRHVFDTYLLESTDVSFKPLQKMTSLVLS